MRDPVLFAIPFFLLLLIIEWTAARKLAHIEAERAPPGPTCAATRGPASRWAWSRSAPAAVERSRAAWLRRDLRLRRALAPARQPVVHVGDRHPRRRPAVLRLSPDRAPGAAVLGHPPGPPLQPVLQLRHRAAAEVEQQRRDLLRGLLPLLGVPPWMVFASFSINLIYQFWMHTERIGKLWRPIEFVFNTPSHHRVHHGMDQQYLDKNYGGILILWDRLFGSFAAETIRPHLRPDQAGGHLQHLEVADPRICGDRPRRAQRRRAGATGSATSSGRPDGCLPTRLGVDDQSAASSHLGRRVTA